MKQPWWFIYGHWLRVAIQFYWKAKTRYDVHSPMLSKWMADVLEDDRYYAAFGRMRGVLRYWEQSKAKVSYEQDPGAGSRAGQGAVRTAKELVHKSAIDEQAGKLLFRTIRDLKPKTILELGTNMGFSAAWMKAAARNTQMITIEGNKAFEPLARKTWQLAETPNIEFRTGLFVEELPKALNDLGQLDFIWIDGDHSYQPTLDYVKTCLPFVHSKTVIAVGDIYWSKGMMKAWEELSAMPEVRLSVDVFGLGLLFFDENLQEKQDFALVPWYWKPWRLGFF